MERAGASAPTRSGAARVAVRNRTDLGNQSGGGIGPSEKHMSEIASRPLDFASDNGQARNPAVATPAMVATFNLCRSPRCVLRFWARFLRTGSEIGWGPVGLEPASLHQRPESRPACGKGMTFGPSAHDPGGLMLPRVAVCMAEIYRGKRHPPKPGLANSETTIATEAMLPEALSLTGTPKPNGACLLSWDCHARGGSGRCSICDALKTRSLWRASPLLPLV